MAKEYLAEQASATGLRVRTTGYFELSEGDAAADAEGTTEPPSVFGETLLGTAGALVVLLYVFASSMAFVPLLVAVVSILATFLCVLAVTYVTDVSFVVQFLIALVGLGVAIDYSLLVHPLARGARARTARRGGRGGGSGRHVRLRGAVPALVSLLGEWNWWLPAWLARPLRVAPSARVPEPVALPTQRQGAGASEGARTR